MQYGVVLLNMGEAGNPRVLAELGQEVEEAGWDGVFVWDSLYIQPAEPRYAPMCDPWIALAAIAMRTERVRIGTVVTPLSRRRPWKVARETVSLDHLSNGRFILPVALGSLNDGAFCRVGEETDRKVRAQRLDEALEILDGLWSGEPFRYHGKHYEVEEMTFLPRPVQVPRIPVWVVGAWPREKSMRRVLRWDGVLPSRMKEDGSFAEMSPEDIRAMKAWVEERRRQTGGVPAPTDLVPSRSRPPFDIVMEGETPGDDAEKAAATVRPLAPAGVTWWLEAVWGSPETQGGLEGMRRRIKQGPPRID
jgi:alkanesulfonate monooxygenase SsuD/methylene tetrahydromethanopterin reductase-like flavin-dependent oxidoreductase (luciferase family)